MACSPVAAKQRGQEEAELSIPECPICYLFYDNIFNAPLLLTCSHTFCLECLARLCVFLKQDQTFQCPLCRETISLPWGGVPKLPVNMDIIQQLPPWMQELHEVWVDGFRLCCVKKLPGSMKEEALEMLVTVDLYRRASSQDAHAAPDLVAVHHPMATCRQMCRVLWQQHATIFCAIFLLLLVVLLPVALILGSS